MSDADAPHGFPRIRLEMVEDPSPEPFSGYLRLVRRKLRAHYPDGAVSDVFVYDEVERRQIDAVVVVAHHEGVRGRHVFLRSSLRPAVYFRGTSRAPIAVPDNQGCLWEVPAGLVEVDEQDADGLLRAAARELFEEAGFDAVVERFAALGPSVYPCPGVIAERHFFFEIEVDPTMRVEPPLDGSALERCGKILDVSLDEALDLCRSGQIEDAKTEVALRRLRERYP